MGGYSTDKDGIVTFRDEGNKLWFDRLTSVALTGWHLHPHIANKFTVLDTVTGKVKEK
jgi:hypothetical protein